ncbi:MAG: response regulator transcription factor [Gammaproteobacteria bacterium]
MKILLIEDDERIVEFLQRGLRAESYGVDVARDGHHALKLAATDNYDVLILDLVLPGVDGREICRQLRGNHHDTPILMLTALDALEDKVEGLRMGADDYLTKPFAFAELLARIEALARRRGGYRQRAVALRYGDLTLNRETREVRRGDLRIDLTPKEFALLEFLLSHPGKVLSKTRILEQVWGYDADPLTNILEVYVRHLRSKIDQGFAIGLIQTVRGVGYKLNVDG